MGTNDLFADNPVTGPLGDGETPPVDQAKLVGDEACQLEEDPMAEGKDGEDPVAQDKSFFSSFLPSLVFLF